MSVKQYLIRVDINEKYVRHGGNRTTWVRGGAPLYSHRREDAKRYPTREAANVDARALQTLLSVRGHHVEVVETEGVYRGTSPTKRRRASKEIKA